MPDAARIAQAQALEVPVVLKGAQPITGDSDSAEIFTENATTVLVFDNGAVLHLRAKLAVGQTVFIHNTQNGREVICKVVEAPAEGEMGLTDLEFTTETPDFWKTDAASSAASEAPPEVHVPTGAPGEDPLAMMLQTASNIDAASMIRPGKESGMPSLKEELMASHEMAPDAAHTPHFPDPTAESFGLPPEPAAEESHGAAAPTGDQIDAALKQMTAASAPPAGGEAAGTEDEKHIAALMARDARLAKFAAFKEKQVQQGQRTAAEKEAVRAGESGAAAPKESEAKPRIKGLELSLADRLLSGKNRTYVAVAAGVLIAAAIGLVWHMMRGAFTHPSEPPVVAVLPAEPKAAAPKAAAPSAPVVNVTPAPAKAPRVEERAAPRVEESSGGDAAPKHHRPPSSPSSSGESGVEPAIVLSQPQPTLPPWAVGVEIDGVVTIDALIDEKGNVSETRVLSGPRALQREAERAIGLWVFEPARENGKAIPSHLTLSVQFLPPSPPKRFP